MKNYYEVLGVGKDATTDEITKAYRKLAKVHHPDKGGKAEDFDPIQKAYDTLRNPENRAHYDRTGEQAKADLRATAMAAVGQLFMEQAERLPHDCDLIGMVREEIEHLRRDAELKVQQLRASVLKRQRVLARIKRKAEGENLLAQMVTSSIDKALKDIERSNDYMSNNSLMLEVLSEYEYDTAKMLPDSFLIRTPGHG